MDLAAAKIKSLADEVRISADSTIKGSWMLASAKTFLRYTPVEASTGHLMLEDNFTRADVVTSQKKSFLCVRKSMLF